MTAPVQVGPSPSGDGPVRPLTTLELAVLHHIADGLTYKQISEETGYTCHAIRKTSTRILRKLNARHQAHAVFLACRAGVLDGRPQRHGDHAGFVAHVRRGEEPCEACWEGERAYRREYRAARKAANANAA
ncbi:response regulator transcription factor [Streptomyces sp. NPDC056112]|uniref:response regulator transcription factor n=1 Tax=Streptomyces sp. NPDC056112 TaxID=3345715 RepID=UPI0035D76EA5